MIVKNRINIDLLQPGVPSVVYAKQWDKLSRYIELGLFAGAASFAPPSGCTYEIRGMKPDGTVLKYSLDEDGDPAIAVTGNIATLTLAQQALSCPGDVPMELCIKKDSSILTSFSFTLRVEVSAIADVTSSNYIAPALTTFFPTVSPVGVISWRNDGGLDNPEPRNIRGPSGAEIVSTEFIGKDQVGGNIYRQTFDNGVTSEFTAPRGPAGEGNVKTVNEVEPDDSGNVSLLIGTQTLENGAVTSAKLASGAVSTSYTATLDTPWTGAAAPYTKEVTVSGILASDAPIVDLVPSDTFSTAEAQEEAWANVYKVTAAADKLTFYAKEKPTAALPVKILCIRK